MTLNSKTNKTVDVHDVVLNGVLSVINSGTDHQWRGTMTDLNRAIVKTLGKKISPTLPRSPSSLRVTLNRVVNRLRVRGVKVRFGRTPGYMRTRFVEFSVKA